MKTSPTRRLAAASASIAVALGLFAAGQVQAAGLVYGAVPVGGFGDPRVAWSYGYAINGRGDVAGQAWMPQAGGHPGGFVFAQGQLQDVGDLGGHYADATGINDAGTVVGNSTGSDGATHAFIGTAGAIAPIEGLRTASDINNAGQVLGTSYSGTSTLLLRSWIWQNGSLTDIGALEGPTGWTSGEAINNAGDATGSSWVAGWEHAFVYRNGTMSSLHPQDAQSSYGIDINDAGVVTGRACGGAVDRCRGFVWADGVTTFLDGLFGGEVDSSWLNGRGDIVANVYDPAARVSRPFLWRDGVASQIKLDAAALAEGWTLDSVREINDAGLVVAHAHRDDSATQTLLLLPVVAAVPEPAPAALFLLGACFVGWWRRRRRRR